MRLGIVVVCLAMLAVPCASWAVTYSWELAPSFNDYSVPIASDDIIQGMKVGAGATIEAGGFHSAFPYQNDAALLTDGQLGGNVDSVLQDYGVPSLKISYLFAPQPIWEIRSFGGNSDKNGRVFQNLDVEINVDGDWFEIVHEATTGPYYVSNSGQWEASLIRVYEEGGGPLLEGLPIGGVRLTYWCPDNTQDWFLPRTEPNAVCASIIKEIDVVVPEPTSMLALLAGVGGILLRRRSR